MTEMQRIEDLKLNIDKDLLNRKFVELIVDLLVANTKRVWSELGSKITISDDVITHAQLDVYEKLGKLYQFVDQPINDSKKIVLNVL